MSTEQIRAEAEVARQALGRLEGAARRRRDEIERRRRGLNIERDKIVAGANLAMRSIDDDDEVLEEEFEQLDGALNPRPATPPELEPMPIPVVEVVHEPEPEPMPTWSAAEERTASHVVVPPERNPANPRDWHNLCWGVALLGAFIGFIVGINTHEVVTDEVSSWKWVPGGIWVLAITCIGFYTFGLVCAYVRDWWLRRNN